MHFALIFKRDIVHWNKQIQFKTFHILWSIVFNNFYIFKCFVLFIFIYPHQEKFEKVRLLKISATFSFYLTLIHTQNVSATLVLIRRYLISRQFQRYVCYLLLPSLLDFQVEVFLLKIENNQQYFCLFILIIFFTQATNRHSKNFVELEQISTTANHILGKPTSPIYWENLGNQLPTIHFPIHTFIVM